jgi:hypothetical protein
MTRPEATMPFPQYRTPLLAAALALALASCGGLNSTIPDDGDSPNPPPPEGFGYIEVSVTTASPPPGVMYTISISNGQKRSVEPNGSLRFTTKRTGTHEIEISSVPAACTLAGDDLVVVSVRRYEHVTVGFSISCPGSAS